MRIDTTQALGHRLVVDGDTPVEEIDAFLSQVGFVVHLDDFRNAGIKLNDNEWSYPAFRADDGASGGIA